MKNEPTEKGFWAIPKKIAKRKDLLWVSKMIAGILWTRKNADHIAFPSREYMATALGVSVDTIDRGIKELKKKTGLRVKREGLRRNNRYLCPEWDIPDSASVRSQETRSMRSPIVRDNNKKLDINISNGSLKNEPASKREKIKRKEFKIPNSIYKELTDAYQQYKGIKLQGAEFGEVKRAIKTMLYSGRTKQDIMNFMKFCAKVCEGIKEGDEDIIKKFGWLENWTILTIKRKMSEFVAGKFSLDDEVDVPSYAKMNPGSKNYNSRSLTNKQ